MCLIAYQIRACSIQSNPRQAASNEQRHVSLMAVSTHSTCHSRPDGRPTWRTNRNHGLSKSKNILGSAAAFYLMGFVQSISLQLNRKYYLGSDLWFSYNCFCENFISTSPHKRIAAHIRKNIVYIHLRNPSMIIIFDVKNGL